MRSGFVVVANPLGDDDLGFGVRFESMLPDAFELERSHEQFSDAVLLRRMWEDELLMKTV